MEQAVEKYYTAGQDVWVYPIKKFEHLSDIKSADLVAYLCKTVQTQYSDRLYKKKFRIINSLQDLEQKKQKLYKIRYCYSTILSVLANMFAMLFKSYLMPVFPKKILWYARFIYPKLETNNLQKAVIVLNT